MATEAIRQRLNRRASTAMTWVGSIIVVAVVLAILAALAVWKYYQMQAAMNQPPPPEMPTAVTLVEVTPIEYRNTTTSIGTVVAPRWITVSNELPGTVEFINLESGSVVEENALLLKLDTSVEQAQLDAARARLLIAESTWRRTSQMAESRAVSELELDQAKSDWQQSQAQVAELEALIARKSFHAPFRGRLGISDTHVGQYLPGGTEIATLQSLDEYFYVDFMLPQSVASTIDDSHAVKLIYEQNEYPATVVAKDAQADRTTRNLKLRAKLDAPPEGLLPGDSVQVAIEYGPTITLPGVPSVAVRYSPQGAFVFVVSTNEKQELRAAMRPVMPVTAVGGRIGIGQGLQNGERVAAEGSFKLQDGALLMDSSDRYANGSATPESQPAGDGAASQQEPN